MLAAGTSCKGPLPLGFLSQLESIGEDLEQQGLELVVKKVINVDFSKRSKDLLPRVKKAEASRCNEKAT